MAREHIMTYVGRLDDNRHIVRHPDGRLEIQEGRTDWARVDALAEAEIERAIADDPDWAEFSKIDWSKAELRQPQPKQAISIRLDPDILAFFKKDGPGYQGRINDVLRHFVTERKRAG